MDIPQSAIEPFGVTGIPALSLVDSIRMRLNLIYMDAVDHMNNSSLGVEYTSEAFCGCIFARSHSMGIDTMKITTTHTITNQKGVVVGITNYLDFTIRNSPFTHTLTFVFGWGET